MIRLFNSGNINLSGASVGKNNNLDFMRFIAAIMVIVSHSFTISYGPKSADFLYDFTNGQLSLGGIAVGVFFLFGGFLIAGSIVRAKTAKKYFRARALRIFPALFFVVFLFAFVIGPILSHLSPAGYFSDSGTYKYLLNGIFLLQHNLPGVFGGNPYGPVVNGALWTLPIEFMCYILCYIAFKIGFIDKRKFLISIPLFVIGCSAILIFEKFSIAIITEARPVILFYIGMAVYIYRDKIVLNRLMAVLLTAGCIVLTAVGQVNIAMLIFFPYIMFTVAYATRHKLSNFAKYGEFSYGIYLWGFPVQQIIASRLGAGITAFADAAIAIPIAFVMAVISYYAVERPTLKLKQGKPAAPAEIVPAA